MLCGYHIQNNEVEQQIGIKFSVKLEHSYAETTGMVQNGFGDDAMNAAQIKVWHKCFKDGLESVQSDPHSGGLQEAEQLRMLNTCMGYNQQRLVTDCVRTRNRFRDSKSYCV